MTAHHITALAGYAELRIEGAPSVHLAFLGWTRYQNDQLVSFVEAGRRGRHVRFLYQSV